MTDTGSNSYTGFEIAVIGMAGRFPGASGIGAFWENLKNGVESISFFSDEELLTSGLDEDLAGHPDFVKAAGVIEGKEYFDSRFFGYLPDEARAMDPQLRLFHLCAWEALEDAGCRPFDMNEEAAGLELPDLSHRNLPDVQDSKFNLALYMTEYKNAIEVFCSYRTNLFKKERIEYMMQQYLRLLENISGDPGKKIKEYLFKKKRKRVKLDQ